MRGLYEWSPFKNEFSTVNFDDGSGQKFPAEILSFLPDSASLWICSYGDGIYNYDLKNKKIKHFTFQLPDAYQLATTWNICKYKTDTFWVGTQEDCFGLFQQQRSMEEFFATILQCLTVSR
jgi:hypothetical protein